MRKRIIKCYFIWNFDKEEKWLNDMAKKGMSLVSVGYCNYLFEETAPGEYAIRMELLENLPGNVESQQYIRFVEDTGAEHLGSVARWVYFRKKTADGAFDLYSDIASRLKHLNRIITLNGALLFAIACSMVSVVNTAFRETTWGFSTGVAVAYAILVSFMTYGLCRGLWKKRKLKAESNLFE